MTKKYRSNTLQIKTHGTTRKNHITPKVTQHQKTPLCMQCFIYKNVKFHMFLLHLWYKCSHAVAMATKAITNEVARH